MSSAATGQGWNGEHPLYFLHVPKTGGTTMNAVLDRHFAADEICPWTRRDMIADVPPSRLRGYRLYRGHFGWGFDAVLGHPLARMTMLRDPLRGAISSLLHAERSPIKGLIGDRTAVEMLRSDDAPMVTSQRYLRNLLADPDTADRPDAMARARAALDQCVFVGLTERFADSVALLCWTMGWPPPGPVQTLNRKPPQQDDALPDDCLVRLRELVAGEQVLYDHARQRFETALARMHDELIGAAFRQRLASIPRQRHLSLPFDRALPGAGWHGHEDLENEHGVPFRWTGPGTESTLDLRLVQDEDLLLQVHVINAIAADVLDSLTLTVNGRPVPLLITARRALQAVFTTRLRREVLQRDPLATRLVLGVARTTSKQALDPADPDDRLLGVCISRLEIQPWPAAVAVG